MMTRCCCILDGKGAIFALLRLERASAVVKMKKMKCCCSLLEVGGWLGRVNEEACFCDGGVM